MFDFETIIAGLAAGTSVTLATIVVVDFIIYASNRYKERYLKEAAVELDDVLLQMPAGRILDLSLALSAIAGFAAIGLFAAAGESWSWGKAIFFGIITAGIVFPCPRLYLKFLKKQRLRKFDEQLEDALSSMSSALKAGFSINQAFETIAEENKRPIAIEFQLLLQEIRLGVPLDHALDNMCSRLGSQDLELVNTAIITARQTGGELTVIFERLAAVIRERGRITGKLRAITAQGKLQAGIIGIMPFLLLFMMTYVTPNTMNIFFNSVIGIIAIIVVVIMVVIGFLVIKKITTIDI